LVRCRKYIHTKQMHFFGILHIAPKMSLLELWFKDERNRKVRVFIAILGEGDRPTFDCRKKGKQEYVRIGGTDSYLKCLHHR
jgi:hypothetical protein